MIDKREPKDVDKWLKLQGLTIERKMLDIGDYLIGDVVIERKTAQDFIKSVFDKRLFLQVRDMKESGLFPILIVTGEIPSKRISVFFGALTSLILGWKIPVLVFLSSEEYVSLGKSKASMYLSYFLASIYSRMSSKVKSSPLTLSRKGRNVWEIRRNMLACIPRIGGKLADRILKSYPNFKALCEAKIEDLSKIKGVSRRLAEEILKVLGGD